VTDGAEPCPEEIQNSKTQAPKFKQVPMTKNPILKTEDRIIDEFLSFGFGILNLLGIWVLALGAFRQIHMDYMKSEMSFA